MDVRIVDFPETQVAAIEHRGSPSLEHESVRKLIEWRIAKRLTLMAIAATASTTVIHSVRRPQTIERISVSPSNARSLPTHMALWRS